MMINATFNNIPVISWQSVLMVEETRIPRKYNRVHLAMNGINHAITTMTAPHIYIYIYMCVNLMLDKSY